jgi:hypothetical protein
MPFNPGRPAISVEKPLFHREFYQPFPRLQVKTKVANVPGNERFFRRSAEDSGAMGLSVGVPATLL